jgi:hypothetical protein
VECTLTLRVGDRETSKADAGEANFEEPFKAAYSDGLKRAARRFGVARYLGTPEGSTRQSGTTQPQQEASTTFLEDVKEEFGYDPDQVVDILGITTVRIATLTKDEKNRAWQKIKVLAESTPF